MHRALPICVRRWPTMVAILAVIGWATLAPTHCAAASSAQDACVTLKTAADIDADTIRLSDIATIDGVPGMDASRLGDAVVGQAPLPGQTRFVDAEYIRIRLKQAGLSMDRITFRGPGDVRVTRTAAALPAARIRAAVEMAIRNHMPWRNEDVAIKDIHFDESVRLPTGALSYRIVPGRNEDYLGQTLLALHLFVDGAPIRKIWVNATISVMAEVVVVSRPLGSRQPVETSYVSIERRDLADLPSDVMRRIDDVIGNRTTRMLYPGTVMRSGMVSLPPLVTRGEIVKIVASKGPMTITATGMVKQQGAKGDLVRVVNTDSNRIITARVTGPGAVAVEF